MKISRILLVILAVLTLPGWRHGGGGGGGGGSCPQGSALPDGCPGAPTGSIQYPTLFATYSPARPSWNVPGVDYYVGVPSNKTPRALGANAINLSNEIGAGNMTFSATAGRGSTPMVTITGNNITVDTWFFNGVSLKTTGSSPTIQNNSFLAIQGGGFCQDPMDINSSGTVLIQNNKIDGGVGQVGMSACYGDQNHGIFYEGTADATIQYNWFTNGVNDHVDIVNNNTGHITIHYNVFDNYSTADTHGDGIQTFSVDLTNQTIAALDIEFNLFYMPANWSFMNSNADGNSASRIGDQGSSGAINNPVFSFNAAVYPAPSLYLGFAAIVQWGQSTQLPNALVHDNWFDPNGIEFSPISTPINTASDPQTYNNKTLPNNAVFLNSQFEKFWTDPSGRPGGTPSAPVITSAVKSGSTAVISGTAAASVTVTIIDPNNTNPWASGLYGSTTSNGSGNWTLTTGTLSAGSHSFIARQTDNAANTSPASSVSNVTI